MPRGPRRRGAGRETRWQRGRAKNSEGVAASWARVREHAPGLSGAPHSRFVSISTILISTPPSRRMTSDRSNEASCRLPGENPGNPSGTQAADRLFIFDTIFRRSRAWSKNLTSVDDVDAPPQPSLGTMALLIAAGVAVEIFLPRRIGERFPAQPEIEQGPPRRKSAREIADAQPARDRVPPPSFRSPRTSLSESARTI